jgi:hypothetical protein
VQNPADLLFERPTKYELVINLRHPPSREPSMSRELRALRDVVRSAYSTSGLELEKGERRDPNLETSCLHVPLIMEARMSTTSSSGWARRGMIGLTGLILTFAHADAQQQPQTSAPNPYLMGTEGLNKGPRGLTSYQPVAIDQSFAAIMAHDVAAKPGIEREHQAMLDERYDLSDRPAQGVTMERGKPLQEGVRVKLPSGVTWEQLAAMSADEIRERGLWPKGFLPLPHPFHPTSG